MGWGSKRGFSSQANLMQIPASVLHGAVNLDRTHDLSNHFPYVIQKHLSASHVDQEQNVTMPSGSLAGSMHPCLMAVRLMVVMMMRVKCPVLWLAFGRWLFPLWLLY